MFDSSWPLCCCLHPGSNNLSELCLFCLCVCLQRSRSAFSLTSDDSPEKGPEEQGAGAGGGLQDYASLKREGKAASLPSWKSVDRLDNSSMFQTHRRCSVPDGYIFWYVMILVLMPLQLHSLKHFLLMMLMDNKQVKLHFVCTWTLPECIYEHFLVLYETIFLHSDTKVPLHHLKYLR